MVGVGDSGCVSSIGSCDGGGRGDNACFVGDDRSCFMLLCLMFFAGGGGGDSCVGGCAHKGRGS